MRIQSLRSHQFTVRLALLFPLVLFAGCESAPSRPPPATSPVPSVDVIPDEAQRFAVDPAASEIRLLVYRDGPLARFGHNHVIIGKPSGDVFVGKSAAESAFRLEVPVGTFEIDPAPPRSEEGEDFAAAVSPQAREATRANMLGTEVLDARRNRSIAIASVSLQGPRWNPTVLARVTLRGSAHNVSFPAAVFERGDQLVVVASFDIRQSDFGITPYSTLGGGLRVRDVIHVRVRLSAHADRG